MPNIKFNDAEDRWPRGLDDLRREPSRLVFAGDLARLRIIKSYDGLKKLPPPLRVPAETKAWEGRTILAAIGAGLEVAEHCSSDTKAHSDVAKVESAAAAARDPSDPVTPTTASKPPLPE